MAKSISRKNDWLAVHNSMDPKDPVEMMIYDQIGKDWWTGDGLASSDFADALNDIPKDKEILIRIHSPGGSVQDGVNIYNLLEMRRDKVTTQVEGAAHSIASVIAMAGKENRMVENGQMLVHQAWYAVTGNADQLETAASDLRFYDNLIANVYAKRTGKSLNDMMAVMKGPKGEGTMFSGKMAGEMGFFSKVKPAADFKNEFRAESVPAPLRKIFNHHLDTAGPCEPNLAPPTAPAPRNENEPEAGAGGAPLTQGTATRQELDALAAANPELDVRAVVDGPVVQLRVVKISPAKNGGGESTPAGNPPPANTKKEEPNMDNTQPAAATKPATNELDDLRAQLKNEKRARVRAEVMSRGANKITNENIDWWTDLAVNDEAGTLRQIDALPSNSPGGAPIGGSAHIEVGAEGALDVIKNQHKTPKARYSAMVSDWNNIIVDSAKRAARSGEVKDELFVALARAGVNPFSMSQIRFPQNSNTITSVLTSFLMDGSVTDLQNRWAMLRAFSLDTRPDGYKPLAPGVLKHVTVGSTAQTNATNYETGDSTVAPVTITPAEHSVSYQISNTDLNSGVRMQDLVTINTANFANKVIEAATAPITTSNFTGTVTTSSAAAFSFSDLATLQALLKKSPIKNLIIDGAYIARIANTPGFFQTAGTVGGSPQAWTAFGWDGIYQNTDWTGAGTNVQGFACNPQAIGGIIGLPLLPAMIPGGILASNVMTVDGLDVQVLAEAWFNPATRTSWNSLRVMDGWAKVDATAGFLLTSG